MTNKNWENQLNLKIKDYVLPARGTEGSWSNGWKGIGYWSDLCEKAKAGQIPSEIKYEIVYYAGGGIWAIAGSSYNFEEAVKIANNASPERWDGGLEDGCMVTSTGKIVSEQDWNEIEAAV